MEEDDMLDYTSDEERFSEDDWVEEPSTSSARKRSHDDVEADQDAYDDDEDDDGGDVDVEEELDHPASKRQRVDDDALVPGVITKTGEEIRARALQPMVENQRRDNGAQSGPSSETGGRRTRQPSPSPGRPDPYDATLPPPCDTWIQLRLQLFRFKGVYRIVRFPLNYTFAMLYRFLMYSFGWSGEHLHEFNVFSHVEMYKTRPGEIKKVVRPVPERPEANDPEAFWQWSLALRAQSDPIMRIIPWSACTERARGFDVEELTQVLESHAVSIGDIWNQIMMDNASKGECRNDEIAIKFVYDFGDEWEVHISIDRTKDGHYRFQGEPRDYPEVMVAKGAPPIEHARHDVPGDIAHKKKVSPLLFKPDNFARYVAGEVGSVSRTTELAIYNIEEERARHAAARQAES
ncbi:hypothetical protein EVJ58_g347 [Rhodofomes roseus]|uniref:Plasmid pRiA4b Orf3-like domain-containing protein n=1 Tax=Rhodofomes roseus TaxID=34475 RepID=A0A4Y9Z4E6_9APHY|nr:hypothetical protein EVJ58_g347 [Rhodofomes roseus]